MIFLNSASSAAALVFYLPVVCTHTETKGKQRYTRDRNILESLGKNTMYNEHPVPLKILYFSFFLTNYPPCYTKQSPFREHRDNEHLPSLLPPFHRGPAIGHTCTMVRHHCIIIPCTISISVPSQKENLWSIMEKHNWFAI